MCMYMRLLNSEQVYVPQSTGQKNPSNSSRVIHVNILSDTKKLRFVFKNSLLSF